MLLTTMALIERFTLERVWTDLADDEFFWEPVPRSWSIRLRVDCKTPTPFGTGAWVADFDAGVAAGDDWAKDGEPFTTIAWLMWHFGSMPGRTAELDFLGGPKSAESGWTSPYLSDHPRFTSATEAVEALRAGWQSLGSAIRSASDEQLERETRIFKRPLQGHHLVASVLNEVSHHGAQVCVVRDLHRDLAGGVLRPDQ